MVFADRRRQDRRRTSLDVHVDRRRSERRANERRGAVRVPLELWMEEVLGDEVYFRLSGNLGEGGVYFDKAVAHARGTMLTLKFALPGERELIIARAKVVTDAKSPPSFGMAVKFIAIEGTGRERLREFINKQIK